MNNPAANPRSVLIAGGDSDPNLAALVSAFAGRGLLCETLFVGSQTHPRITWNFDQNALVINGIEKSPGAVFLRYDVFTSLADHRRASAFRAHAWFTTIAGWALTQPKVRMFNRASAQSVTNKLEVLRLARELGLEIPVTTVTNDHALLSSMVAQQQLIAKPVNGGDYTRELADVMSGAPQREGSLAAPSFVQERLVPPEVRVYWIAGRTFAFQVVADALDYRTTSDCKVVPIEDDALPRQISQGLGRLMERLEMDFGAADFKTCPVTGQLRFLELNNGPMFAAFDNACEGRLTAAMVDFLSTQ
jgi:hypothetical protein